MVVFPRITSYNVCYTKLLRGKTTTSAAFSAGLALRGYRTVVIDFDVGLRNLDLIMGCERRVVYDLLNVIHGEGSLNQALIKDKRVENLSILPASLMVGDGAPAPLALENVPLSTLPGRAIPA